MSLTDSKNTSPGPLGLDLGKFAQFISGRTLGEPSPTPRKQPATIMASHMLPEGRWTPLEPMRIAPFQTLGVVNYPWRVNLWDISGALGIVGFHSDGVRLETTNDEDSGPLLEMQREGF